MEDLREFDLPPEIDDWSWEEIHNEHRWDFDPPPIYGPFPHDQDPPDEEEWEDEQE